MPERDNPTDDWSARLNRRLLAAASVIVGVALVGGIVTQSTGLQASESLHLQIEYFAVFASISIFFLASAKYVISRERAYLPLSLGFLGASIFDLLHPLMPNGGVPATIFGLSFLIVDLNGYLWWMARISYGVGLLAAAYSFRTRHLDAQPNRTLLRALLWTLIEVILLGLFVAVLPLPFYYGVGGVGRFLELLPMLLYAWAVLQLLRPGAVAEAGLRPVGIASLMVAIVAQAFAAISSGPGDAFFFTAHVFKIGSYLVVLFGLYLEHVSLYAREHALRTTIEEAEQEALRRRAELFAVIENTADGILILDHGGRVLHLNRAAARLLEPFGARSWVGGRLVDALPPLLEKADAGRAQRMRHALTAAVEQGTEERDLEVQLETPDDRILYLSVGVVPLREEAGRIRGAVADLHDVTSLRTAEQRYRDLTEGAPDAIIEMDFQGRIAFFNAAAERLFGHPSQDVLGQDVIILMPKRYRAKHQEGRDRFFETGIGRLSHQPLELAALRKDGREVPIELTLSYGPKRVTAVVRDVSSLARGRREKSGLAVVGQAVNATDNQKDLCENAAQGLQEALNYDSTTVFVRDPSRPFLQLISHVGARSEDAPRSFHGFRLEPPDQSIAVECLLQQKPMLVHGRDEILRRSPKSILPLEEDSVVLVVPIVIAEKAVGVLKVATRASRHDADQELQTLQTIAFQLALGISQKTLVQELRQTAHNLEVTNRELDAFIYTASHDLAEPLRSMANFSQFLIEDYSASLDTQGQDYLKRIHDGAIRMRSLLDALLQISRIRHKPLPFETLDMKRLLQEVRDSLDAMLRERKAEFIVQEPMPQAWGQPTRVMEVFTNLISNGLKFNDSASPRVEISGRRLNGMAEFRVKDNGIGIPEKYQDRVFGLFTRLHPRGQYPGTGAGLAIVRTIIEQHGGQVRLESKEGQGTMVVFTLPTEPR